MNFEDWVWDGVETSSVKETYRGGIPASSAYVFPMRRNIDKALLALYGDNVVQEFASSRFGTALGNGGIGKNSGRFHRVSATGAARGWFRNRDFWDTHLIARTSWVPHFTIDSKVFGMDSSVLSYVGALFGSEEKASPEVRIDYSYWLEKHRGRVAAESVMSLVDITGMSFDDYSLATRIADYDHHMSSPFETEQSVGGLGAPRGFAAFRYQEALRWSKTISNELSNHHSSFQTWGWICTMRNRREDKNRIIDEIISLTNAGATPLYCSKMMKLGIKSPKVIEMVLNGTIDLDIAKSLTSVSL